MRAIATRSILWFLLSSISIFACDHNNRWTNDKDTWKSVCGMRGLFEDIQKTLVNAPDAQDNGFYQKAMHHITEIQRCTPECEKNSVIRPYTCSTKYVVSQARYASYYSHYALKEVIDQAYNLKETGEPIAYEAHPSFPLLTAALYRIPHAHVNKSIENPSPNIFTWRTLGMMSDRFKEAFIPLAFHTSSSYVDHMLNNVFAFESISNPTENQDYVLTSPPIRSYVAQECFRYPYINTFSDNIINTYRDAQKKTSHVKRLLDRESENLTAGQEFGKYITNSEDLTTAYEVYKAPKYFK